LLHGAMPDAMILCHQPSRRCVYGSSGAFNWVELPELPEAIRIYESAIAPLRTSRVLGIALNTWDLPEDEARAAIERAEAETGLPVTDPVRYDAGVLAEAILNFE
jgi:uncharacterized NAD-dependent epimerase/dehydratase family protein